MREDNVAGVATLWALNIGFWWLLAAAVVVDRDWRWSWRELKRDFGPVRRWLFGLPPDPPPKPLREPVYYQPSEPG